jgi:predicted nucleic acid-binding protein
MQKALIDSDVLLDFFLVRQPFSEDAARVLTLCEQNKLQGYVTPVILSNVYYILSRFAGHAGIIKKLNSLISITDVLIIDRNAVLRALASDFRDFEDALQSCSAENSGFITLILTRNTRDYKHSSISVMTPQNFLRSQSTRS